MTLHAKMRRPRRVISKALALAVLLPAAASAQDLPPAQQLLDAYITAIGGRAAVLAASSAHTTGQFSMPAMGITGDLEVYSADGKTATRVEIPGLGVIRSGYNGEVGWALDPMVGPRVLEGAELAQAQDEAAPEASLRDPKLVASMETVEKTTMNGQECYKVKVAWKSGRETFDCYSTETGLIVGMEQKSETQMGTIDMVIHASDYKQFGSIRMPSRITQQMMQQEQVMTITNVNVGPVDPSVFELPPEIQALIKK
jgi:hypothetical protein